MQSIAGSCKELTRLTSESFDRRLAFRERLQLRIHLVMCAGCRLYERQLVLIRRLVRGNGERLARGRPGAHLSDEAKERILEMIRKV